MVHHDDFLEFTRKIVRSPTALGELVCAHRTLGRTIVATVGSWDLLHIGHVRYLIAAKRQGDILVVGVDTDRVIKLTKGTLRPVAPDAERIEMLSYQACVDYVTPLDDADESGRWQYGMLNVVQPDVFVAAESSGYTDEQLKEIERLCGKLVVFPRQAESTSTSILIQKTVKAHLQALIETMSKDPHS
jgi:D-glycero-beta-D-manno-heptose 1-phosphate adenylyltransferase